MTCQYCEKKSYITDAKCYGCVARYILRTYTSDNQAEAIQNMADKYVLDYQTLRAEAARQWRLNKESTS